MQAKEEKTRTYIIELAREIYSLINQLVCVIFGGLVQLIA